MEISIIVPVYNTEKWISRCLESILSQSFQDFEVIIVDDCGKDNAIGIAKNYAERDSRIKIIHHDHNKGLMTVRKTGYQNAQGKYFMFVDSDDSIPAYSLETLHSTIQKLNCDIIIGGYTFITTADKQIKHTPKVSGVIDSWNTYLKLLSGEVTHNLAFCLFSRKLFENKFETIPNQTNGEDLILFYQLVGYARRIGFCGKCIYNYFQNYESSSYAEVTPNKIKQYVNTQNFKIRFLSNRNIERLLILKNIVPLVARWYNLSAARDYRSLLDPRIIKAMRPFNSIKYLSAKHWILYMFRSLNFIK